MTIEKISQESLKELTMLILELWPECTFMEEYQNCEKILHNKDKEIIYLARENDGYIGFIHVSLRSDYVAGATSYPVAYIEGIYVKTDFRKSGIAKSLVLKGEEWARVKGCKEYASDTEIKNSESLNFHEKIGFNKVNEIVCFIKPIQ